MDSKQRKKGKGRKRRPVMGALCQRSLRKGTSTLECRVCYKEFNKRCNFEAHYRTHTGEKPFQCDLCGRSFSQKSNMKSHKETHKKWSKGLSKTMPPNPLRSVVVVVDKTVKMATIVMRGYVCPYCQRIFDEYSSLRAHMPLVHLDKKVFYCPQLDCIEFFKDEDALQKHKLEHADFCYRCVYCNHFCKSLEETKRHEKQHTGYPQQEKKLSIDYPCNQCDNVYRTPEALKHHYLTSPHEFPCRQCDVVCDSEGKLRKHIISHTTIELFKCNICKKPFRTKASIKQHMPLHGKPTFSCEVCSALFFNKYNLQRHRKVHEKKKTEKKTKEVHNRFEGHCRTLEGHLSNPGQCCKYKANQS